MRSLFDGGSEWRQKCADMKHLPAELAWYIRNTYSEYWVAGQFSKIGGESLSWPQIVDLCARVQQSQSGISQGFCHSHGCMETHLEVFSTLEIVCVGVPGEVNCTSGALAKSHVNMPNRMSICKSHVNMQHLFLMPAPRRRPALAQCKCESSVLHLLLHEVFKIYY